MSVDNASDSIIALGLSGAKDGMYLGSELLTKEKKFILKKFLCFVN